MSGWFWCFVCLDCLLLSSVGIWRKCICDEELALAWSWALHRELTYDSRANTMIACKVVVSMKAHVHNVFGRYILVRRGPAPAIGGVRPSR